ncbi:MAG: redoxin domain-containing protein [Methanomassiliicoccales archaeon]|nr:redoxin domain-containing protein [Methanomassiliicoccales archaeon]
MCCPRPRYVKDKFPELKPTAWINAKAVEPKDVKNKVVLVYFFSFGDEFSETAVSHLSYLHKKMRGKGLVVIGVHAPSLEKEKDIAFVKAQAKKFGIEFPIAVDNDYCVWKAFRNQFYGQFHFVDDKGTVRHTRSGDDIAEEVEMAAVHLLNESGKKVDLGPEIDGVCLEGDWYVGDGYVELEGPNGSIDLRYIGEGVDLVLSSPKAKKLEVTIDGEPIAPSIVGRDIIQEGGKSYLLVGKEKSHQVAREKRKVMREVEMKVRGKGLRLMGFCVVG